MRFYRLDRVVGGDLPEHPTLKVGAIIRVRSTRSLKPGPQWNGAIGDWVTPVWVECEDPTATVTA